MPITALGASNGASARARCAIDRLTRLHLGRHRSLERRLRQARLVVVVRAVDDEGMAVRGEGDEPSDLRRTVESHTIWSRFSGARAGTVKWYRDVYERLKTLGFKASIMEELRMSVEALEQQP